MYSYLLGLVCRIEPDTFEFEVKDLPDLSVVEVFKDERRLQWESPCKARIDVSKHLFHLVLISQQKNAPVFTCRALDFGYDGVDDCCGFVGITNGTTSQHVSLVDNENFADSGRQDGLRVSFRAS
jgi:hypothetical protein